MFGFGAKKRILVIDDDADLRTTVAMRFTRRGYTVLQAGTGEEGLAMAAKHRPEAIILDVNMPGVDGFETCRRLRDGRRTRDIPIVMLTACKRTGELEEGLQAGADTYITKPFDGPELVDEVEKVVEGRRRLAGGKSAAAAGAGGEKQTLSRVISAMRALPRTLGSVARVAPGVLLGSRDERLLSPSSETPQHRPIMFEEDVKPLAGGRARKYMRFSDELARSLCPDASVFDASRKVLVRRTYPPLVVALDTSKVLVDKAVLCVVPRDRTTRAEFLLGVLVSRVTTFALDRVVERSRGGVLPWVTPPELERLPLPGGGSLAGRDCEHQVAALAEDLIRRAGAGFAGNACAEILAELDDAVWKGMGLGREDMRIVVS